MVTGVYTTCTPPPPDILTQYAYFYGVYVDGGFGVFSVRRTYGCLLTRVSRSRAFRGRRRLALICAKTIIVRGFGRRASVNRRRQTTLLLVVTLRVNAILGCHQSSAPSNQLYVLVYSTYSTELRVNMCLPDFCTKLIEPLFMLKLYRVPYTSSKHTASHQNLSLARNKSFQTNIPNTSMFQLPR